MKILKNNTSGRLRVLMRRDQVLKICANHQLTPDMQLRPMAKSTQAFTWFCQDFSDGELKSETLAAKFKTAELAEKFKKVFEQCVESLKSPNDSKQIINVTSSELTKTDIKNAPKKGLDGLFSSIPKKTDEKTTVSEPKVGFGDKFKPAAGSWACAVCLIRNDADKLACVACGTNKDGGSTPAAPPPTSLFSVKKEMSPVSFKFALPTSTTSQPPKVDSTDNKTSVSQTFSFGFGSGGGSSNVFGTPSLSVPASTQQTPQLQTFGASFSAPGSSQQTSPPQSFGFNVSSGGKVFGNSSSSNTPTSGNVFKMTPFSFKPTPPATETGASGSQSVSKEVLLNDVKFFRINFFTRIVFLYFAIKLW